MIGFRAPGRRLPRRRSAAGLPLPDGRTPASFALPDGRPFASFAPASRRSAAALGAAALCLTTFAGPAQATSGPTVPHGYPAAATAAGGFASAASPDPDPAPGLPAPLIAPPLPEAQAIAAKYQADVQAVQTKVNAAAAEQIPLERRAGDVQTREANLDGQFASVQARTTALNGQADALNNAIAAHNAAPHEFQLPGQASQLARYNKEKADLEAQQSSLRGQFSALTTQTNQLQSAKAQADADQAQVNADIEKHNTTVAALKTDIANLQTERQADLAQIAGLLQNFLAGTQTGGASPLATAGGDQSAPAAVAAPPQAQALPSGGGDQSAPPLVTYAPPAVGTTGTAGAQTAPGAPQAGTTPPPAVTQAPVTTYLAPSVIAAMPAGQAADVSPSQTYGALIPEPSGNYAVLQLPPPAGTTAPPGRQAFSDAINNGGKATAYIAGKPVVVDHVVQASPAPAVNQGADTARPAQASPLATALPKWLQPPPAPKVGPPVSIDALRGLLAQNGLGKLANQFDLEYAPVVLDVNGNPVYATAPVDAQGNPALGQTGKPIIRISNLGLQNAAQAVGAFADQALIGSSAYSPCPQHSFSGETRVLMAGGTTEPIADVKVGDLVENAEPGGGTEVHRVDHVHVTTMDTGFVDVVVGSTAPGGGGTVTGTANHPYYDASAGAFVDAGALGRGDLVQSVAGTRATVAGVHPHVGPIVTYDLAIDGLHTFYVVAGDTPVLVHNCGGQGLGRQVLGSVSDHILDEHRYPGGFDKRTGARKDAFPQNWSDDEILDSVADVLTNPNSRRTWKTGSEKFAAKTGLTRKLDPAVQDVIGKVTLNGYEVTIDVRFEPFTDKVLTAFPIATRQLP